MQNQPASFCSNEGYAIRNLSDRVKGRIIFERLHLSAVCFELKNDSIIYTPLPFEKELGSFPPKGQKQ